MSKAKLKRLEKEAEKQAREAQTEDTWHGKRAIILISSVFIALILLIIGVNYYFSEDQKYYRIDVIQVDDLTVDMDYFVRRCHATGLDPMSALTGLTNELVIKKEAEAVGLEISEAEILEAMMATASGDSPESITRSEFDEWLRQRLNETRLSEKEYKEIVRVSLMSQRFYEAIVSASPTSAKQVFLNAILVDTEEEALEIKARLEAGEVFADVAAEVSIDATKEDGGAIGWIPRGIALEARYDSLIFDELEIGVVSDPQAYHNTSVTDYSSPSYINYFLLMVSDKADSRPINEQHLGTVNAKLYNEWVTQKLSEHTIKYHGIKNGFDSETYSWINWQLQKLTGEDQSASE